MYSLSAITICKAPDIYTECELAACLIKKLIRAKWIAESWAAPFKGKTMKGYRCLLDAKQKEDVRTEQQQLHLPDNYVYDFEADRWTDPANLTPTESEF